MAALTAVNTNLKLWYAFGPGVDSIVGASPSRWGGNAVRLGFHLRESEKSAIDILGRF